MVWTEVSCETAVDHVFVLVLAPKVDLTNTMSAAEIGDYYASASDGDIPDASDCPVMFHVAYGGFKPSLDGCHAPTTLCDGRA